ncbi:MAG: tetratricopeptide repeat protein [Acidobacteriota bacterium]
MRSPFQIQRWQVEPSLNRIEHGNDSTHLNPKAMEVLIYLHERRGEVCGKAEILQAVWQDTFVSEAVLTSAIWELRRAFGDDARRPTVIETIPKRGYRLIPDPEDMADETPDATSDETTALDATSPPADEPKPPKHLALLLPVGVLLLVGIGLLAVWRQARQLPAPPDEPETLTLAVLPFANNTSDPELDWLRHGIPDLLVHGLGRSPYLRLVSLETVSGLLGSASGDLGAHELANRVQEGSGAQVVVTGRVLRDANRFRILAQLHDFDSGRQAAEEVEAPHHDAVLELGDRLAGQIRVALEIEASDLPGVEQGIARTRTDSVAAYKHFVDGKRQLETMQLREAIAELQQAVALDDEFAHAHELLANAYDIIGEKALARDAIQRAVEACDRLPRVEQVLIARRQAQLEDDISAELDHLKQLVALQPREAQWLVRLAWFQAVHRRDCEQSVARYRQAIAVEPTAYPYFHAYLAETYLICSNPAAAFAALEAYADLMPNDPTTHHHLGNAYYWIGDYAAAERELGRSLELQPDFTFALRTLGDVYRAQGLRRQAEATYQTMRASAVGPSDEEAALVALADLALDVGRAEQAVELAEQALAVDPTSVDALWILGLAEIDRRDLAAAERASGRITALLGDSASRRFREHPHHLDGRIAQARGDFETAIRHLEQALALHPLAPARFRHDLAAAHLAAGDLDGAAETLSRLFELNPGHARSRCAFAEVLARQGRRDAARDELARCQAIWRGDDWSPAWLQRAAARAAPGTPEVEPENPR